MSFRSVIALLLLATLLQAVSLGGRWAVRGHPFEGWHAMLHWSGVLHHHDHQVSGQDEPAHTAPTASDEAGFEAFAQELAQATVAPGQSLHQDHSLDSRHHLSLDAFQGVVGLLPAVPSGLLLQSPRMAPPAPLEVEPADPFLSGPRRPPKTLA